MASYDRRRCTFSEYYTSGSGRFFRWLDWAKARLTLRVVKDMGGAIRILDLGCGTATISARIAQIFPKAEVCGADADERLVEIARRRGVQAMQVDFDRPLPYEDGDFDLVLMIDSIEHVRCRRDTMGEVGRVLRAEGKFVVFTPPYDAFSWWLAERLFRLLTRRATDHISPFTRESLEWLLHEGFTEFTTGRLNLGLTMYGIASKKKDSIRAVCTREA